MRLSNEDIKVLDKIRMLLIQAGDSGICINHLEDDIFPRDNGKAIKLSKYIHIMNELKLVTIKDSKFCGVEYYVNDKLQHNTIQSIADKLHKEENQKDLEFEKTKNENEFIKRQLKDYKITKMIAYIGLAIAIASFIVSILK
ncbi:hypothetical protein BAS10_04685 [Elizabethkingia meningoseptica]|uniref:hypothetical protein n=1 Tax=Elizabethkingia meningoseptica TaxID=238 RepID=UPI000999D8AB|nr:hypothetical protein [Elizabethkingia meningoseptica]OPB98967.1 hypothetical protein BAS10_04685 [Elizabethkingia meningoseptica]